MNKMNLLGMETIALAIIACVLGAGGAGIFLGILGVGALMY